MRTPRLFEVAALAATFLVAGSACSKSEAPAAGSAATATGSAAPAATEAPADEAETWYVCPMPEDEYWQHGPGRCPKCGMHLERAPEGWTPPGPPAAE